MFCVFPLIAYCWAVVLFYTLCPVASFPQLFCEMIGFGGNWFNYDVILLLTLHMLLLSYVLLDLIDVIVCLNLLIYVNDMIWCLTWFKCILMVIIWNIYFCNLRIENLSYDMIVLFDDWLVHVSLIYLYSCVIYSFNNDILIYCWLHLMILMINLIFLWLLYVNDIYFFKDVVLFVWFNMNFL